MGKADDDLTQLLAKLYDLQERVGAKPVTTDEEKLKRAENVASMGKGRKAQAKGSRFLELKSSIIDRLKHVHKLMLEVKELEGAGYGGDNPQEVIRKQAEIREQIRQATDDWKELEGIYKKEARKKRSKFSPEDLEKQAQLVQGLHQKLEEIREAQMSAYTRSGADETGTALGAKHISSFGNAPTKKSWNATSGGGVALTENQKTQIQLLEDRDADFDRQLDEIGEGVQDLTEIAQKMGEEVQTQNAMLDSLDNKIEQVGERVQNVNSRMKETLDEVGRASDKLCVDIMCIVLALGFGAVFYNMFRGNN